MIKELFHQNIWIKTFIIIVIRISTFESPHLIVDEKCVLSNCQWEQVEFSPSASCTDSYLHIFAHICLHIYLHTYLRISICTYLFAHIYLHIYLQIYSMYKPGYDKQVKDFSSVGSLERSKFVRGHTWGDM